MADDPKAQLDKFKATARELGVDENDEEGFTEIVRRVAALRPKDDSPKPPTGQ